LTTQTHEDLGYRPGVATLSPGWATDLAVLELSGSTIEDRDDHLVVRTPSNPLYHWGNCLFVTAVDEVDDAARWIATFGREFPEATWVAIGLIGAPPHPEAWTDAGVTIELDEVLTTRTRPRITAAPPGYTFRQLTGDDWEQVISSGIRDNERSGEYEPTGHEQFMRARVNNQRTLCDTGVAAFFGAFDGDALVADLGIVKCGTTARYQAVQTDEPHRRRGLASHLLGVAARWSIEQGCDRWVIVTETTNAAGRVYRSVGFAPDESNAQAYRPPPR
jgi:GNAT superfamily N-acetyltransferase